MRIAGLTTIVIVLFSTSILHSHSGPFDGRTFKGRIAFSSDGNYNDEDDWGAFPVAIAVLDAFGVAGRLVHVDYSNILATNDPRFYSEMAESVLGSAERYSIPRSILFDCQKNLAGAVESIKNAINASSADNPLYYVLAGPMEVPFRGIEKSDPDRRKYVYCISHSRWNDGYASSDRALHSHNKRDVIPSGINWIQVKDGNPNLAHPGGVGRTSTPEQWSLYHWLRDSSDPRLRWVFTRLEAEGRADISDATMTYFLLTGDEDADLGKLKSLLDDKQVPAPMDPRKEVRIEAENFRTLDNYTVEDRSDRRVSHRLSVKLASTAARLGGGPIRSRAGRIRTSFDQPYTADRALYDVEVRYFDEKGGRCQFGLYVNGEQKGSPWHASKDSDEWTTHTIADVAVASGDEIMVEVSRAEGVPPSNRGQSLPRACRGDARDTTQSAGLDYVQLNYKGSSSPKPDPSALAKSRFSASGPLDDPAALPGQVIVAGSNPGYLKYNGGGPVFLSGPDNPEEFLFRGTLNADGTRSGGGQTQMIDRMARAGVNAFHCLMTRMKRCNFKNEGDDTHTPFVNHDPSQGLNENVLNHWDEWLGQLEDRGIIVHLEFYNDATDVERMGWTLNSETNLHPDERRWIEGVVKKFKHHRNILWGIEESCNKLPKSRTAHFKKIGEIIARTDDHNHPIVQSFVVPNDPEGDFPADGITSDENMLTDDGRINAFMEQTDFHTMKPRDDLAAGSTRWVLANPGDSYIAYTYDYSGPMGVKSVIAGTYNLKWFDTVDGDTVTQTGVWVPSGDVTWNKPDPIGSEVALYIKRQGSPAGGLAALWLLTQSQRAAIIIFTTDGSRRFLP